MAAVAGLRGTGDWATDERPKNFRQAILFRNPNGMAPIFALTGKIGEESVDDAEFNWWDESNDIIRIQINNGAGYNSAATVFAVDSQDPDASNPGRVYGLPTHLKPGDLLMIEKTEVTAFDNETVMVVSVDSATQITVVRGVAGTTAQAITDDDFLTKIGSAYAEGSGKAAATSRNPTKYTNYCEIFKTAYNITNTASKTKTRTGDPLKNDKMRKTFDHAKDIEMSILWGNKFETVGSNGKPLRFMGGLREFIPSDTTTIFGSTTTLQQWLDATYKVFDWDSPAGDERIMFCGNGYLNVLNAIAKAAGQVRFVDIVEVFGMKLQRFVIPQGTLYLKSHPLLNRHPRYTKSAFIMDFSAIKYRYLRDTYFEDDIQTPGDDQKMGQWLTECSIEVKFGGLTCGYHGNLTAAA